MTQAIAPAPVPAKTHEGVGSRSRYRLEPAHLLVPVIALVTLYIAARPVSDIDTYWHVLIGQEVLAKHSVTELGDSWALFGAGQGWQTTQWLSEVGMYLLHRTWGWYGITAATFLLSCIVVIALGRLILRGRPARIAVLVYGLEAIPLSALLISRPQLVSLVFLIWLAHLLHGMRTGRTRPRPVLVGLVTAVWANLHGYWVLVPAFLLLGTFGGLADHWSDWPRAVRRWMPSTLAALVGGCLTPIGAVGLVMPIRFEDATRAISEWSPTTFASPYTIAFLLLMLGTVWAWARTHDSVPRSELITALGAFSYSAIAMRNVFVSALVLAPLFADRLGIAFPQRSRVSRREITVLAAILALTTVTGSAAVLAKEINVRPLSDTKPLKIAAYLHALPGDQRVLNDYNTAGPLLAFGPQGIRLAIDGRADRNGAAWIAAYQNAMALKPGWEKVLDRVKPNYAVLSVNAPLLHVMVSELHWQAIMTDQGFVLLKPGGSA